MTFHPSGLRYSQTHRSIVRLRPLQLLLGRLCAYEEAVPVRILLATKRHWGSSQHFTELFFVHRNGVYQLRKEIELIDDVNRSSYT
jgi:hypothetical protein